MFFFSFWHIVIVPSLETLFCIYLRIWIIPSSSILFHFLESHCVYLIMSMLVDANFLVCFYKGPMNLLVWPLRHLNYFTIEHDR